jgi:hypothetical protein
MRIKRLAHRRLVKASTLVSQPARPGGSGFNVACPQVVGQFAKISMLEIVFLSKYSSSLATKNRTEGPLFPKMASGYTGASTH